MKENEPQPLSPLELFRDKLKHYFQGRHQDSHLDQQLIEDVYEELLEEIGENQ